MNSIKPIKMVIEDTEVEAVVTRSRYEISVAMTKPASGLAGGSHIPLFGRRYDFDGVYGERRIVEILEDMSVDMGEAGEPS